MPGFYEYKEDRIHWRSFKPIPSGSIEMDINDWDIFPELIKSLTAEGVRQGDIEFEVSVCHPLSGNRYGQVCAQGVART